MKIDYTGAIKKDLDTHKAESMPHKFTDTSDNKTYKYGFEAQNGELVFKYEEVI